MEKNQEEKAKLFVRERNNKYHWVLWWKIGTWYYGVECPDGLGSPEKAKEDFYEKYPKYKNTFVY